jgi:hypothetical protein
MLPFTGNTWIAGAFCACIPRVQSATAATAATTQVRDPNGIFEFIARSNRNVYNV